MCRQAEISIKIQVNVNININWKKDLKAGAYSEFPDLDRGSKVIIYESMLTTFEANFIFFEAVAKNGYSLNQTSINKFILPNLEDNIV
jgi:hypothetical protein